MGDGSSKSLSFGAANFLSSGSRSRLFQQHRPKESANETDGGVCQTESILRFHRAGLSFFENISAAGVCEM